MPQQINDRKAFTLTDVLRSLEKTISERYKSSFWVLAEMNKLNHYSHSGHCYPELVEKQDGVVVAEIRSNLWRNDYQRIDSMFRATLGEPLKDGIKILFKASVNFSPKYGLSLLIHDIDPSYTLGDIEKEKRAAIAKLTKEGIIAKNRSLNMPRLPQRIAVISVETSKGYADFMKVLENNVWEYRFFTMLFPSLLQGEKATKSIIAQLEKIRSVLHHFDAVAIIRGGGGDVGLSSFNNYELARAIALFPIPVLSGIGHATNETVSELVSNVNAITPTKVADILIQSFHNFSVPVQNAQKIITEKPLQILEEEGRRLNQFIKYVKSITEGSLTSHSTALNETSNRLGHAVRTQIRMESERINSHQLQLARDTRSLLKTMDQQLINHIGILTSNVRNLMEKRKSAIHQADTVLNILKPDNVLKRGYAVVRKKGKAIVSSEALKTGESIDIELYKGSVEADVKKVKTKK